MIDSPLSPSQGPCDPVAGGGMEIGKVRLPSLKTERRKGKLYEEDWAYQVYSEAYVQSRQNLVKIIFICNACSDTGITIPFSFSDTSQWLPVFTGVSNFEIKFLNTGMSSSWARSKSRVRSTKINIEKRRLKIQSYGAIKKRSSIK